MSIATNLAKLALGIDAQGLLATTQGGTGTTIGINVPPTVATIGYPGDDTAVNTSGGDTVTLTGTNFNTGVKVLINNTQASVVTRISSTVLTFLTPAQATGSYIIYVINTDGGTAISVPGIQYSPVPTWTTAAGSLGSVNSSTSFSSVLAATGDAPVTYSIASGTLPSGITLNSTTGALSGTTPSVSSSTTYTFVVRSTDAQLQDTDRSFSITVISNSIAIDYLIVAGGGGAGGSGGGAGGYLTTIGSSQFSATKGTSYTITVGAAGTLGSSYPSTKGGDSTAFGLTAYGGGAGGIYGVNGPQSNADGGSGGGGNKMFGGFKGRGVYPGSGYINGPRQGYDGHMSSVDDFVYGSGGGAGGPGAPSSGYNSGGPGVSNDITGIAYTYSVGGDGSFNTGSNESSGNAPGLGTYGKGGDGWRNLGGQTGNGIVVVRYADSNPAAAATTGSPTVTVAGGYRVYKFTSSGSITF